MEMSITVVVMKMVSYFPLFFMYILLHPSHLDKSSRNFTYQLSVDCLLKWAKFKDFALYTAKSNYSTDQNTRNTNISSISIKIIGLICGPD